MSAAETISGAGPVLLLGDHASNAVPADIDLGIDRALLDKHIAVDIGSAAVTRGLAERLGTPAILANVSRLVIDLNREPDHIGLVPRHSDGHRIPGNDTVDRFARIARFHAPYHRLIRNRIRAQRPRLILSVHSFTPRLEQGGSDRLWQVGVLYNRDVRAAMPAVAFFRERGFVTGDNEPYSGRALNATLNRHGEGQGIPSVAIEIRNDLIRDAAGAEKWVGVLADLVGALLPRFSPERG